MERSKDYTGKFANYRYLIGRFEVRNFGLPHYTADELREFAAELLDAAQVLDSFNRAEALKQHLQYNSYPKK